MITNQPEQLDKNVDAVWKFQWDCGRMGTLSGVIVTTLAKLEAAMGQEVYFGEVLGKHSDIYGILQEGDFRFITDDSHFIDIFSKEIGSVGHNPFHYMEQSGH